MWNKSYILLILLAVFTTTCNQPYGEVSQWRGPERNGTYPGESLMNEWPEDGPSMLWTNDEIGQGYSSAVCKDDVVYVAGKKDSTEYLYALDLSGKILWEIPYGLAPRRSFSETRVTPTIEGDLIYLISGRGQVVCISAESQEILWSVEAYDKYHGAYGIWEVAESPLLVEDKIVYTPAGNTTTMVAFDRLSGELVWKSESIKDTTAYVSPIWFERGGKKIIVNVLMYNMIGVDASNGDILWTFPYSDLALPHWDKDAIFINCVTPVYKDGKLFITSGYNHTSVLFNVSEDGREISVDWKQPVMDTHHGGVVLLDGYVYGSNWINNRNGNWICLDWETGEVMYDTEWICKGSIIASDSLMILYEERFGNIGLVEPTPDEFRLISSFKHSQGSGPHWAHPTLSEGILYIRHGQTLTAYNIGN
jgi:outer membrane protein assembly factor BamB